MRRKGLLGLSFRVEGLDWSRAEDLQSFLFPLLVLA